MIAELVNSDTIIFEGETLFHRTPICHLARHLSKLGRNGLVDVYRNTTKCLSFDIEDTAKLTILENESVGPVFAKFREFPDSLRKQS